jgi:hypothetical protein
MASIFLVSCVNHRDATRALRIGHRFVRANAWRLCVATANTHTAISGNRNATSTEPDNCAGDRGDANSGNSSQHQNPSVANNPTAYSNTGASESESSGITHRHPGDRDRGATHPAARSRYSDSGTPYVDSSTSLTGTRYFDGSASNAATSHADSSASHIGTRHLDSDATNSYRNTRDDFDASGPAYDHGGYYIGAVAY